VKVRAFRNAISAELALKLDQFLKFQGLVATGGEAKLRIQRGDVRVNGLIETRRGRQLGLGDAVQIDGRELLVTPPPRS
jgi:ribosome-associated protein